MISKLSGEDLERVRLGRLYRKTVYAGTEAGTAVELKSTSPRRFGQVHLGVCIWIGISIGLGLGLGAWTCTVPAGILASVRACDVIYSRRIIWVRYWRAETRFWGQDAWFGADGVGSWVALTILLTKGSLPVVETMQRCYTVTLIGDKKMGNLRYFTVISEGVQQALHDAR